MRTWSATITQGNATVEADLSPNDLKADQTKAAIREATEMLNTDEKADVNILKTTKAHGTVTDRSYVVYYNGQKNRWEAL